MSDPRKTEEDIVATTPEDISDDKLEDVDGGYYTITMTNATISKPGLNADTIYGGSVDETIFGGQFNTADQVFTPDSISVLRRRPTR